MAARLDARDAHLVTLGKALRERGYRFTAVSPQTRRRINARPSAGFARDLRDVFGWGRPFLEGRLTQEMLRALDEAGALERGDGGVLRSKVRFSTVGGELYLHGGQLAAFREAVPFGPYTYRFVRALARLQGKFRTVIEVGCGAGAGGLFLASRAERVILADVHPLAQRFARINAELAGVPHADAFEGTGLEAIDATTDLVIAHPQFLASEGRLDSPQRDRFGLQEASRVVHEALRRLPVGAKLVVYGSAPVMDGTDLLLEAVHPPLGEAEASFTYEELDPDIAHEVLEDPEYVDIERIAAVVLTATRK